MARTACFAIRALARTTMRASAWLGVSIVVLASLACTGPGDFHCTISAQCGSEHAFCEPEGRCSFVVAPMICASGRRYGEAAGPVSGKCVAPSCTAAPPAGLAAGDRHACLLRTDGTVACWGDNDRGQLGDGTSSPRSAPVAVAIPGTIVALVTGSAHSCALRSTGLVYCWGANDHGQLGDGSQSDQQAPVSVRLNATVTQLAAGADFTCASLASGDVTCWGGNDSGQCGVPSPSIVLTPNRTLGLSRTRGLAAGHHHVCAFDDEGKVSCWGNDTVGQLGDGATAASRAPVVVAALGSQWVSGLAAGDGHTCALAAGRIFCWGANNAGQLGLGTAADVPTPTEISSFHDALAVTAGSQHTCARRADDSVWCWGGNSGGQLGEGTTSSLMLPVPVAGHLRGSAVAAGGDFTCALESVGGLSCWGNNRHGELALGNRLFDPVASAVTVPGPGGTPKPVSAVAVGSGHVCVTSVDAFDMACWGANQAGQLGTGDLLDRTQPTPTKIPVVADKISAGGAHSCAVRSSAGTISCWGRGNDGQLGNGSVLDARLPVTTKDTGFALNVSSGGAHTCAVHADNTVFCWGKGSEGQLGDGLSVSRATPVRTTGVLATQVALGDSHSCALLADDRGVACWGRGAEGQLGLGDNANAANASRVTLPPSAMIAAGAFHTCAVDDLGNVRCWGQGKSGQLGNGQDVGINAPALVPGVDHVVGIGAGRAHTCALLGAGSAAGSQGQVLCWGDGQRGQTGAAASTGASASPDASASPIATSPALVSSESDFVALGLGGDETCLLTNAGALRCLGDDESGQLGQGGELQFPLPQPSRLCP